MGEGGASLALHLEAALDVGALEGLLPRRGEAAAEDPVVLWDEGLALLLLGNHQGQGGRLDAASAAHVADAAVLDGGEVAGEHGTPDEVDVLAALPRMGEVEVELHELGLGEGLLDLLLDEGTVARAADGSSRVFRANDAQGV